MAQSGVQLAKNILCHCWNSDCSQVALCPHNNEVHIFSAPEEADAPWSKVHVLKGHDQLVSGIDWSLSSNLIVTVSHDRNAYVWTYDGSAWQPQMVLTRLHRAALCVKWSPSEAKFAIGSSSKWVCICHFEKEHNWWVSKLIKKQHQSSIVAVAWHPSSALLATASTDFKCRVINTFIPGIDSPSTQEQLPALRSSHFGEVLLEVDAAGSWVHSVAWSRSGTTMACCSHDACVRIIQGLHFQQQAQPEQQQAPSILQLPGLPAKVILALGDRAFITGGWDGHMYLLQHQPGGGWSSQVLPTEGLEEEASPLETPQASSLIAAKLEQLRLQAGGSGGSPKRHHASGAGSSRPGQPQAQLPAHSNCIISASSFRDAAGEVEGMFTTAGLDGRVVLWVLPEGCR